MVGRCTGVSVGVVMTTVSITREEQRKKWKKKLEKIGEERKMNHREDEVVDFENKMGDEREGIKRFVPSTCYVKFLLVDNMLCQISVSQLMVKLT